MNSTFHFNFKMIDSINKGNDFLIDLFFNILIMRLNIL
jgi:hypothetical protein